MPVVAGRHGVGQQLLVAADRPPQPPEKRMGEKHRQQTPPKGQEPQVAVADMGPLVG